MEKIPEFHNEHELTKEESSSIEEKIDNILKIDPDVAEIKLNMKEILNRDTITYFEKDYNRPQSIFFIPVNSNTILFGRKTISVLYKKGLIPSRNCSLISDEMIIGILYDYKKQNRDIIINYYPLFPGERKYIFNEIKFNKCLDIVYPFKFFKYDENIEVDSPADGWKIFDNTREILYNGEKHFREYTLDFLKGIDIKQKSVFFDPACSTGDFLYSIKKEYPFITAIGQDLSSEMVEYSKDKLDIVYQGDSLNSKVKDDSVDFLFLRFLNSRVVTTEKAIALYECLEKKVKKGGYIICFGHTPILLKISELKKKNYKLISCHGYTKEYDSIFQYYIFRRKY